MAKGKVTFKKPAYGPDVTLPEGLETRSDNSRSLYVTTGKHKLKKWGWFTRLMVSIFPRWPFGQTMEGEASKEERIEPR